MSIYDAADNYPLPRRPPRAYRKPSKMTFLYKGDHRHFLAAKWSEYTGHYRVYLNGMEHGGFFLCDGTPHDEFMKWIRSCYAYDTSVFEHGFNYIQEEGPELSKCIMIDEDKTR